MPSQTLQPAGWDQRIVVQYDQHIAACKPLFLELWCPPAMSDTEEHILFGRRPATQNPSALPVQTFDRLMRWADLSLRAQHLIA